MGVFGGTWHLSGAGPSRFCSLVHTQLASADLPSHTLPGTCRLLRFCYVCVVDGSSTQHFLCQEGDFLSEQCAKCLFFPNSVPVAVFATTHAYILLCTGVSRFRSDGGGSGLAGGAGAEGLGLDFDLEYRWDRLPEEDEQAGVWLVFAASVALTIFLAVDACNSTAGGGESDNGGDDDRPGRPPPPSSSSSSLARTGGRRRGHGEERERGAGWVGHGGGDERRRMR